MKFLFVCLLSLPLISHAQQTEKPIPVLQVCNAILTNVTIGTRTPDSISLIHSTGVTRVGLACLPPELRARYAFTDAEAEQYLLRWSEETAAATAAAAERTAQRRIATDCQSAITIKGRISQVLDDGILLIKGDFTVIFIAGNFRASPDATDGQSIRLRGRRDGKYEYVTVQGAAKTVARYSVCPE